MAGIVFGNTDGTGLYDYGGNELMVWATSSNSSVDNSYLKFSNSVSNGGAIGFEATGTYSGAAASVGIFFKAQAGNGTALMSGDGSNVNPLVMYDADNSHWVKFETATGENQSYKWPATMGSSNQMLGVTVASLTGTMGWFDVMRPDADNLIEDAHEIQFRRTNEAIYSSGAGQLDIKAGTELQIVAPTVDINASSEVNISADLTVAGHDGSSAGLKLGSTLVTATAAELNKLDGVTATTAELNYLDLTTLGSSEASKVVSADANGDITIVGASANMVWDKSADQLEFADNAKAAFGDGADLQLYHDGSDSYVTNRVGALNVGTGVSGVAVNIGHSTSEVTIGDNLTVTGNLTVSGTTTTVDVEVIQSANGVIFEGATADAHETTLKAVDPTSDQTVQLANASGYLIPFAAASTTTIAATPAELNIMDGGTSATSTTVADADRLVLNDGGTMKQVAMTDFEVYFESALDTLNNVTSASSLATVGTITSGVWNAGAVTSSGAITQGNLRMVDGEIDQSSGDLLLDVAGDIKLDADGADVIFLDGGTEIGRLTNSSSDFVIGSSVSDKDLKFGGNDGGSSIVALTLDMSEGGAASFASTVTAVGSFIIGSADLNEADMEKIDGITDGTAAANKALVLDANKDIGTIRNLTIDGVFTDGNYTFDTSGNVTGLGTVACGAITASGTSAINDLNVAVALDVGGGYGSTGATISTAGVLSLDGQLNAGGNVVPDTNAALDLGTSSLRWRNIYTSDMHFANERGDWTLIEEADFLGFRNNKTGRRFRMVMEDITDSGDYGPDIEGNM